MTPEKKAPAKKQAPVKKPQVATYVGGLGGVTVHLPSGRNLTFHPGESHPILASEEAALVHHPEFKLADEAEKETS